MDPSHIPLTKNAQMLLSGMTEKCRIDTIEYLNNPILQRSINAGESAHLLANVGRPKTWMETTYDANSGVDIQLWGVDGSTTVPMDPDRFAWFIPLVKNASNLHDLEFRRMHATLAMLAAVAQDATRYNDMVLFKNTIEALAKHVPWIRQADDVAQRLHSGLDASSALSRSFHETSMLADIVDADTVRVQAMPLQTVQALLMVHASIHSDDHEPKLYALQSANAPATYLFVEPPLVPSEKRTSRQSSYGSMVWLDEHGCPLFIHNTKKPNAHWAKTPTIALNTTSDFVHGCPPRSTNWEEYNTKFFNNPTRIVCNHLAAATPHALNTEESMVVVNKWLHAEPTTQELWEHYHSKTQVFSFMLNHKDVAHECLCSWGSWAVSKWAQQHPTEHAVLDTLLGEMDSLEKLEEWRQQMKSIALPSIEFTDDSYGESLSHALNN